MLLRVLVASDSTRRVRSQVALLAGEDVITHGVCGESALWESYTHGVYDLVFIDEATLGDRILAGIRDLRSIPDAPEIVVFSGSLDPTHRISLTTAGALAVLDPAATKAELLRALHVIVERRAHQGHTELSTRPETSATRVSELQTCSPTMREFLALVKRVIDSDSTLLLQGETGVGKEFLARAIHAESPRSGGPFVPVNCSALSETLLESELFGHEEGAFTGAQRSRRGYFELAHRGTLFIDEIGELSQNLQVKLLRVIQDRTIQPVGAEEEFEVDVRIVAATHRDLVAEMNAGRFRADLYYRLSVVTLEVPPLRERREDIPQLVSEHLHKLCIALKRHIESTSARALQLLVSYDWPGNVRELANVIERAVLLSPDSTIDVDDLPEEIRGGTRASKKRGPAPSPGNSLEATENAADEDDILALPYSEARRQLIDAFEVRYLHAALQRANGRMQDAARMVGLNPRSLYEKMRKHGLRKEYFKIR